MYHSFNHTLNTEIASHKLVIEFSGSRDYISDDMTVMLDETTYMGGRYNTLRDFGYRKLKANKLKDGHYNDIIEAIRSYLGDLS